MKFTLIVLIHLVCLIQFLVMVYFKLLNICSFMIKLFKRSSKVGISNFELDPQKQLLKNISSSNDNTY